MHADDLEALAQAVGVLDEPPTRPAPLPTLLWGAVLGVAPFLSHLTGWGWAV